MPSATVITANSSTSGQTPAITSTKAKVTANASVHYQVGVNPTAYAGNCDVIPAGSTRFINMEGLGNKLAFITATGSAEVVVVPVGYVATTAIPQVQST